MKLTHFIAATFALGAVAAPEARSKNTADTIAARGYNCGWGSYWYDNRCYCHMRNYFYGDNGCEYYCTQDAYYDYDDNCCYCYNDYDYSESGDYGCRGY